MYNRTQLRQSSTQAQQGGLQRLPCKYCLQQGPSCIKTRSLCQKQGQPLMCFHILGCAELLQHCIRDVKPRGPTFATDRASCKRDTLKLCLNQVCSCCVCAPGDLVGPAPAQTHMLGFLKLLVVSSLCYAVGRRYCKAREAGLPIKVVCDMGHRRLQGRTRKGDGEQVTANATSVVFGIACCNTQMRLAMAGEHQNLLRMRLACLLHLAVLRRKKIEVPNQLESQT